MKVLEFLELVALIVGLATLPVMILVGGVWLIGQLLMRFL